MDYIVCCTLCLVLHLIYRSNAHMVHRVFVRVWLATGC